MTRRELAGARAVVTGASSGIGRALAAELAGHGAALLITARRGERLAQIASQLAGEVHCVAGDITEAGTRDQIVEAARSKLGGLDLLINNAGVGAIGPFQQAPESRLRAVMEVNFFAPLELTRAALPLLAQGRHPMLVNIASVLGHRAVPNKSEYCASKFALHGITDALRAELAPQGIDVLLVNPSTTASEFFDRVIDSQATDLPWRKFGQMSSEQVARKTVRAIRKGRQEIVLSAGGRALVWLDRLWPSAANRLTRRFS